MTAIVDDVEAMRKRLHEMGARTFTGGTFVAEDPHPYCWMKDGKDRSQGAVGCPTCHRLVDGKHKFSPCPPRD